MPLNRSREHVFNFLIEALLLMLLLFSPLAFGARAAWSEEIVIILSAAIAVCFLIKLACCRDVTFLWTWVYLPAVAFLILVVFQIVPFPAGLIGFISPHTAELKSDLLNDLPMSQMSLQSMSVSFYPHQTMHDLRLLLALFFVFIVVVNVFADSARIKRLLGAISLIGAAIALIALAQDVFGNGKIYWCIPTSGAGRSGPFVNHNHFGQYMNLSIGAAIGWVAIRVHEDFAGRKAGFDTVAGYILSPTSKLLWVFVAAIILCATAVFASLTRGGVISLFTAGVLILLLVLKNKKIDGCGWIMTIVALLAFNCILFVGFDAIYDRLATLKDFDGYACRWQTMKDLTVSFRRFPLFGTGLGTHAVIYPMFQKIVTTLLFTHAENEYVQLLEECGIIGFLIFAVFAVFIVRRFLIIIRTGKSVHHVAVYGLGLGLLAALIHSLSDYGQHVPANAVLSTVFCGLLVAMSRELPGCHGLQLPSLHGKHSLMLRVLILAGVGGIAAWSLKGAENARIAETYRKRALRAEQELEKKNWQGTNQEYANLIRDATSAVNYQPQNKDYLYCLGVYRWYSMMKTEALGPADIVNSKEKRSDLHEIIDLFNRVRTSCPTYGPAYSMLGLIEKFILNDNRGAEKIKEGFQLAPNDPIVCFTAGRLDVAEGKIDKSLPKFEKAVQLDNRLFKNMADIYIHYLSRPELAIRVAGDDYNRLHCVLQMLEDMQYKDLAGQTREKMKDVLECKVMEPNTSAASFVRLADLYNHDREIEKAIVCYQRALELEYAQVYWRMTLARLLVTADRIQDAVDQTKICLQIKPQFKEAEQLLKELSVSPQIIHEKHNDYNNVKLLSGL